MAAVPAAPGIITPVTAEVAPQMYERAVTGWLTAFSWPAAEAARAAAAIEPLERGAKVAERPVAPAPEVVPDPTTAPATLAAAGEAARRIAAGPGAAKAQVRPVTGLRATMDRSGKAAPVPTEPRAGAAVPVAAEVAATTAAAAAGQVQPTTAGTMAVAVVAAAARPTPSAEPRTCASGKGGKSRRITASSSSAGSENQKSQVSIVARLATARSRCRDTKGRRDGAMDLRQYNMLSEELRSNSLVYEPSRELFWPNQYVEQVLRELAAGNLAILGLDIITIEEEAKPCIQGTSAYQLEEEFAGKCWRDRVDLSLQLALRDFGRIESLSDLKPPFENVYFAVVAVDQAERIKLSFSPRMIWAKAPKNQE